jgi:hypothetical protein
MSRKISICVLLYGDHPDLAKRCLASLGAALPYADGRIQDIRLALNVACKATKDYVDRWSQEMWSAQRLRILHYVPDRQVGKYPLMRRMFYDADEPLADLAMWFDDDSYIDVCLDDWWGDIFRRMEGCHMIGQSKWYMPVQGKQWDWIKTQPWYNRDAGLPEKFRGRLSFRFCQGAWWVIRRTVLEHLNWPVMELNHNGGDSMLGEALRHQGFQMGFFDRGLRINADEKGRHSKAKRRGMSEPAVGKHFKGEPLPTEAHHNFKVQRTVVGVARHLEPTTKAINLPCWW